MSFAAEIRPRELIKQVRVYATMGQGVLIPAEQVRELARLAEETLDAREAKRLAKERREKLVASFVVTFAGTVLGMSLALFVVGTLL